MKILVLGGTRFFGIPMVEELIQQAHEVTIATRQPSKDNLGDAVQRIQIERTDPNQMEQAFKGKHFDVVYDKIAYCSNDIKNIMDVIDCDKYIYMSSTAVYEPKKMDTKEVDLCQYLGHKKLNFSSLPNRQGDIVLSCKSLILNLLWCLVSKGTVTPFSVVK